VRGIADISGGRGFIRTSGYLRSGGDIPLTANQVRQFGLRNGDLVEGAGNGKTLSSVESVSGIPAEQARQRRHFDDLTPVYPNERLRLENGDTSPTARIIDLVSPIGKGQRGLIVAPPKAGKTMVLKTIARAIANGYPDVHLMMVLVGERPEEVTDLQRSVRGEVIYSTFDQSPDDHIKVAELAIERAKRLAELGRDVVVLLDSLTRLGRAYNLAAPNNSRTLTGGVAASALQPPRHFLGAARCLEEGGSLTILSTALIDTGSQLDNVLFEEFKGTGNMELRLRRDLAEKRLFPAIDAVPSGTRREDLLMDPAEHSAVVGLRRALAALDPQHAIELLIDKAASPNGQWLPQARATTR
jgi:transcription termination factor Rho